MQWGYTMSGLKMGNTRMKLLAGAVMFLAGATLATSAMSTQLYGGGATLPAGGYVGWGWVASNTRLAPDAANSVTLDSASMFGAWAASTSNTVQYCQTGSGGGKRVLDGDSTTLPSLTPAGLCGSFLPAPAQQNAGFQIPSTAIGQPDFAASDAPMSPSEYSTFVANHGTVKGEPIQFPAVVGSIAVIYNNSDKAPSGSTTEVDVTSKINLTTSDVCKVFAGEISNWNQLDTGVAGKTYPSRSITVVSRSDGSGTTFNFMNHLNAVCTSAIIGSGKFFVVDQSYATATAHVSAPTLTAQGNGNPAVVNVVNATPGAIAYAETANTLNQGIGASAHYATIDSKDPVTGLPASFTLASGSVLFDKTVSSDPTTGAPVLNTLTPNSTANCLAVVNPTSFNNPSTGYPIVGVSYIIANQKGNSTNLNTLRSFINFLYTHAGVTTIGTNTGLGFIGNAGISVLKVQGCTAA